MSERLHPSKENPLVIKPESPFEGGETFDFMAKLQEKLAEEEGIANRRLQYIIHINNQMVVWLGY